MKLKKALQNSAIGLCTAAMVLAAPMSVLPVWATTATATATPAPTVEGSVINSKAVTFTIHKYDWTAVENTEFGDDVTAPSKGTGTGEQVTLDTKITAHPLKGVVFTMKKVAGITAINDTATVPTVTPSVANIVMNYAVDKSLAKILFPDLYGEGKTNPATVVKNSDELNTAMQAALADGKKAELEACVEGGTSLAATDDNGEVTANVAAADQGLYLVVETKVPENVYSTTDPFLVSLPMTKADGSGWNYGVHVYPKNQSDYPTIDKKVKDDKDGAFADTTSVSMGDTIEYQIESKLPSITTPATYLSQYTFTDSLCAGLTYVQNPAANAAATEDAKRVQIVLEKGTTKVTWNTKFDMDSNKDGIQAPFGVTYDTADSKNEMKIAFTAEGLKYINENMSQGTMTITYKATVDNTSTDAATLGSTGNENTVTLDFKRTNTGYNDTLEDKAIVYSYGIDLTKTFNGSTGTATNVQFVLKRTNKAIGNAAAVEEYVTATATSANSGVYYVGGTAAATEKDKTGEVNATKFSPNASGNLTIYGLEADTYTLTEIKTDTGFSLLKDSIIIVITPETKTITAQAFSAAGVKTADVTVTDNASAGATVDGKAVTLKDKGTTTEKLALAQLKVVNTKSFTLPATGGLGSIIFTVLGAVVVGGAVIIIKKDKKKAE